MHQTTLRLKRHTTEINITALSTTDGDARGMIDVYTIGLSLGIPSLSANECRQLAAGLNEAADLIDAHNYAEAVV